MRPHQGVLIQVFVSETIIYQTWLIPHKLIDNRGLWMIPKFWEITISIIIIIFQELDCCSLKIAVIRISICLVLTMESFPVNCVELSHLLSPAFQSKPSRYFNRTNCGNMSMEEMDNLDFGWEEPTHSLSSLLGGRNKWLT